MLYCHPSIQCRSVDPFSSPALAASIIFRQHHPSHVTPEALLSYRRIKIRAKNGSCSVCHSHVKIRKLKVNVNCQGTVANSLPLTIECGREWVGGPIVLITFCTMSERSKSCSCSILFFVLKYLQRIFCKYLNNICWNNFLTKDDNRKSPFTGFHTSR